MKPSKLLRVGFIGWRGMVGSVLMQRLTDHGQFKSIEPIFFSSQFDSVLAPTTSILPVQDAQDLEILQSCDVLVSCQGSRYTKQIYPQLHKKGYQGYWLDSASYLRSSGCLVLDPVNHHAITRAIDQGEKCFVGANCTVSLLLLALLPILDQVTSIQSMTYQSISGAGMQAVQSWLKPFADMPSMQTLGEMTTWCKQLPLGGGLLPWIDKDSELPGISREEWKGEREASQILARKIAYEGYCVRVGVLRAHSQAVTVTLKKTFSLDQIIEQYRSVNWPWLNYVPNTKEDTFSQLTPSAVMGTATIAVGRLQLSRHQPNTLRLFTIGDQLIWGAAEPLRLMLSRLIAYHQ